MVVLGGRAVSYERGTPVTSAGTGPTQEEMHRVSRRHRFNNIIIMPLALSHCVLRFLKCKRFRVHQDSGFIRIQDSGIRIQDAGCKIQDSGFMFRDSEFGIQDSSKKDSRIRIQDSGCRIQDSYLTIQD